jgi:hypothetical protein
MRLMLTDEQAQELRALLEGSLRDMSHEIAATDNPAYRTALFARRQLMSEIADQLGYLLVDGAAGDGEVLERELAHPGG